MEVPPEVLIVPGCLGARRRTVSMRGPAAGCVALRVAPADKALCGRRYKAIQSKMAERRRCAGRLRPPRGVGGRVRGPRRLLIASGL